MISQQNGDNMKSKQKFITQIKYRIYRISEEGLLKKSDLNYDDYDTFQLAVDDIDNSIKYDDIINDIKYYVNSYKLDEKEYIVLPIVKIVRSNPDAIY